MQAEQARQAEAAQQIPQGAAPAEASPEAQAKLQAEQAKIQMETERHQQKLALQAAEAKQKLALRDAETAQKIRAASAPLTA
jgi:hypothetical protein